MSRMVSRPREPLSLRISSSGRQTKRGGGGSGRPALLARIRSHLGRGVDTGQPGWTRPSILFLAEDSLWQGPARAPDVTASRRQRLPQGCHPPPIWVQPQGQSPSGTDPFILFKTKEPPGNCQLGEGTFLWPVGDLLQAGPRRLLRLEPAEGLLLLRCPRPCAFPTCTLPPSSATTSSQTASVPRRAPAAAELL